MFSYRHPRFRRPLEVAMVLLAFTLVVAVMWDWVAALVVAVGGILFAVCCYLVAYHRAARRFYDLPDTKPLGPFVESISETTLFSTQEQDTLNPFIIDAETEQEKEDKKVRALLSQVTFPDEW